MKIHIDIHRPCLKVVAPLLLPVLISALPVSPAAAAPFKVGERLEFKVYFEFIRGGTATMTVSGIEDVDGKPCYRFTSEAHSTRTVDAIYKVRDRVESWQDTAGVFSRRYIKRLREGKYKDDKRVEYKPEGGLAFLYRGSRETPETLEVAGHVQDVLAAFYNTRMLELEPGKSVFLDLHDINKRYDLEVKTYRRERVEVPAGKFDCIVVEPLLQSSGLFRKEGELKIWLSDDEHRIPVLMQSQLYFGRVWAKLVKYRLAEE